jgi:uncharacterized protein YdeI (YjbR/CyaY-like superfamily)
VTTTLKMVEVGSRAAWRRWLERHHQASPGIWLVFPKAHTGAAAVAYEDAVCEALCFGWIDSLVKRLDADRYARKFTPRKPDSSWSAINRRRWTAMKDAGLLGAAGRRLAPTARESKPPPLPELPPEAAEAFKKDARAWRTFQSLPPSHRRRYLYWVFMAKRPETRARRLQEAIELLREGKPLGLK